ncbi:MAG: hypothetical protein R3A79_25130 [Nannocystaceae bacterium]
MALLLLGLGSCTEPNLVAWGARLVASPDPGARRRAAGDDLADVGSSATSRLGSSATARRPSWWAQAAGGAMLARAMGEPAASEAGEAEARTRLRGRPVLRVVLLNVGITALYVLTALLLFNHNRVLVSLVAIGGPLVHGAVAGLVGLVLLPFRERRELAVAMLLAGLVVTFVGRGAFAVLVALLAPE